MMKRLLVLKWMLLINIIAFSQTKFSSDPDSALFVTSDIDLFWKAFDNYRKDSTQNTFAELYVELRTPGILGFTPNRIENAENLLAVVKGRMKDYAKVRPNTLEIAKKEKQCRSAFYALKYLYPKAEFPPVYFVIGAFNSGGTANSNGLYIGAEMQEDIDNIPFIVAHELIHFQQKKISNPTLLQQSIIEGSADFIGELISGAGTNPIANDYGNKHKEALCAEFVKVMNNQSYTDWLYSTSKKDDRPNDLGYWMGYCIAKQFYDRSANKREAIYDILNITDFNDFLKKSDYLNKYIK